MKLKSFIGALALGVVMLPGVAQATKIEPGIRPQWSGAEIGKWTMDYNAAFEAAATNGNCRGVVMYFTGLWWCPYCRALEEKVLSQQGWKDYAEENNLYLVAIDNPARNGVDHWCWLWESDYLAEIGMTEQEGQQEILERYALQTKYAASGATYNVAFDYYQIGYPVMLVFRPGETAYPMGRTSFPDFRDESYTVASATANVLTQFDQVLSCDVEDEKDNTWQGATALNVSGDGLVDFGSRTLSPRDTYDWYTFESDSGKVWTFAITPGDRGATNNVMLALYSDPTKSAVTSKTVLPSATASLAYTTTNAGTFYLRVGRSGAAVVQGYHLAYNCSDALAPVSGTWTGPGALMFTCQRENGAAITLSVNGAEVTSDFVNGGTYWVALPAGKQAVVWDITGPVGASGTVKDIAFTPLEKAVGLSPLNQSIVAAAPREGFFTWAGAALPAAVTPRYMVYTGLKSTALLASPEGAAFEETSCPRVGISDDMDWLTEAVLMPGIGKVVYWRVDTVIEDAYGRQAMVQGGVSSVSLVAADAPTVDMGTLPPDCEIDITDGATVWVPPLTVGVQAMVGPFELSNVAAGAELKLTVKNGKLPPGLRAVVVDGAVWITGVPKTAAAGKTGAADVILSVKQLVGKKKVTVPGTSLRISWAVAPLGRTAGQYNGFYVTVEDEPGYGNVSMTVSAAGKVSGKFLYEGTQYTFSAPNFDMIDATGNFVVTNILAKAGKTTLGVSLGVKPTQKPEATLILTGGVGSFLVYRNNWADPAPMGGADALANYVGYYTAALPVESLGSAAAPAGSGYFTLTTKANGSAKYAGVLADGKSMSGSATLLYGPDCCSSSDRLMFYLQTPPAKNNSKSVLYGVIQLVPDVIQSAAEVTLAPAHTYMTWFSLNPSSVYGYDATTGISSEGVLGFTNILNVAGGYYAKDTSLVDYYGAGAVLGFEPLFGAPLDFSGEQGTSGFTLLSLPVHTNLPMTVTAAAKLAAPAQVLVKDAGVVDCDASVNPWDMAVTFKPATGLFTASFKAYYQNSGVNAQQKTKAVKAKGVFVPQRASHGDTADWFGFYLITDKCLYLDGNGKTKSYPFGWSYDVRLGIPAP